MATATLQALRRQAASSSRASARLLSRGHYGPSEHSFYRQTSSSLLGRACQQTRQFSLSVPRLAATALAEEPVRSTPSAGAPLSRDEIVDLEDLPATAFSELEGKVSDHTLKAITSHPFKHTHMTPVQMAVLPLLPDLAHPHDADPSAKSPRDLLVRAKTGTGKTLAFLVPAIELRLKAIHAHVEKVVAAAGGAADNRFRHRAALEFSQRNTGALIISPTRELAQQIAIEAQKLTHHHEGFEVRLFTGGDSKRGQLRDWSHGRKDIVVATPGRLRDVLQSVPEVGAAMKCTQLLILDEADSLLDMGFRDDLDFIVDRLPESPARQTFLFSATISRAVEQVARKTLNKDRQIFINTVSASESPVHAHVPQFHTVLPTASEQLPHLLKLLALDQLVHPGNSKVILFCPTTKMTQLVTTIVKEISRGIFPAGRNTRVHEIHSRLSQAQRTRASDEFRKTDAVASILVTSDVSARGVDYPNVTRVIQVGVPASAEQYVHRVGRTGRSGGIKGRGDIILLPWEHGFLQSLREVPLKPFTMTEVDRQLLDHAKRFDEDPKSYCTTYSQISKLSQRDIVASFKHPFAPSLSALPAELKNLLSSLDQAAIEDTFSSYLGFYASRTSDLRISISAIIQGCKDWATQAMALDTPPYVSESMLKRLGAGGRGGGGTGNSGRRLGGGFDGGSRRFGGTSSWADEPRRDSRRRGGEWSEPRTSGFGLSRDASRPSFDRSSSPRRSFDRSDSDRSQPWTPRRSFDRLDSSAGGFDSDRSSKSFGGFGHSKTQSTLSGRGNDFSRRGSGRSFDSDSEDGDRSKPSWLSRGRHE